MTMLRLDRHCLGLVAVAVFLAACGGQSITQGSPPILSPGAQTANVRPEDDAKQDLLYVSSSHNSTGDILIYTFPEGRFKKKGSGSVLVSPSGECADGRGHVYVTNDGPNSSTSEIIEYAHGGTKPIRKLHVTGSDFACSVDPANGDLAVAAAQVAIFRHAKGSPTYLRYPRGFDSVACQYDKNGNLFVDGVTKEDQKRAALVELPAGSSKFVRIRLPSIPEGQQRGDVRWDGKNLTLSDGVSTIYQLAISGKTAKIVGLVELYGASHVASFWIQDDTIVGADYAKPTIMLWSYPGGGQPFKILHRVGARDGVTVSVAPHRK